MNRVFRLGPGYEGVVAPRPIGGFGPEKKDVLEWNEGGGLFHFGTLFSSVAQWIDLSSSF